jgi:hypothetical protein
MRRAGNGRWLADVLPREIDLFAVDGSDNLSAIIAVARASPAAVAGLTGRWVVASINRPWQKRCCCG